MAFFKRLTPITAVLYLACLILMAAAAYFTVQFFIWGAVIKMFIAFCLIGVGWYLGALATINLRPGDGD